MMTCHGDHIRYDRASRHIHDNPRWLGLCCHRTYHIYVDPRLCCLHAPALEFDRTKHWLLVGWLASIHQSNACAYICAYRFTSSMHHSNTCWCSHTCRHIDNPSMQTQSCIISDQTTVFQCKAVNQWHAARCLLLLIKASITYVHTAAELCSHAVARVTIISLLHCIEACFINAAAGRQQQFIESDSQLCSSSKQIPTYGPANWQADSDNNRWSCAFPYPVLLLAS